MIEWTANADGTEIKATVYVVYDADVPVMKVLNDWMDFTWCPTYAEAEAEMLRMMEMYYPNERIVSKFHIMAVELKRSANIVV